jgi:hypothetical protein
VAAAAALAGAGAGGLELAPPRIAPNQSESALYLHVLDHAEPSAAGPALRRDDSVVGRAAQHGRVISQDVDQFR